MFYGFDHWSLGELVGGMNFYGVFWLRLHVCGFKLVKMSV